MCIDPVSAGLALSVASSVAGFVGKEAQYQRDKAAYAQNTVNALAAGRDEQRQITTRALQEQGAYRQQERAALLQGAQAEAEVNVSAAEGGVAGLSVGNLISDVYRRTASNRTTLETNWNSTALQLQQQADASTNKTQSRINSVTRPVEPSVIPALLDMGSAGVKAYGAEAR